MNSYLKDKFGERVLKVCIDGGFTCPNRDGTKSYGGCIFCGAKGAGENIKGKCVDNIQSIQNQVNTFLNSYRGERANKFIAYFQSFSNTYDNIENLKLKYDTALLCSEKIIGLQIATRPDLIDENIVSLLKSYKDKYYICVELGLQTANDAIGKKLNRGYLTKDFIEACELLKKNNIDVVGHVMVGLPDEREEDVLSTIDVINNNCNGIKIHSTYIQRHTQLEKLFNEGKYVPISRDYYISMVAKIISRLNPKIVVHRINADPPREELVAPDWMIRKKIVLNEINRCLERFDIYQGDKKL